MKLNFDLFEKMQVNLGTVIGVKNNREQETTQKISECFQKYIKVFCKIESAHILEKNKFNLELHRARKFLEKEKADTCSGILDCLTTEISTESVKEIVRNYNFICQPSNEPNTTEEINQIYANVVLGCIKPESAVKSYQDLLGVLSGVLMKMHQEEEYFFLLFIAVVLLWPTPKQETCIQLGSYISQLKTSYREQMKEIFNGKRPIVHFLLGKKNDYERLVPMKAIQSCIPGKEEQFASMWGNGQIWKNDKVRDLLQRVKGQVKCKWILADTHERDMKLEVIPMYRSQISGFPEGTKVSFFIGFSMKGPLALDIERC